MTAELLAVSQMRFGPPYRLTSDLPVISFGCGTPMISSIVGAMSARMPSSRSLAFLRESSTRMKWTGPVVWAVKRLAGHGVDHLLGVAVVGGDQSDAAGLRHRRDDAADAGVDGLDGLDRGVEDARVPDHVAVGEVEDDHVVLARRDALLELVGDLEGAHLRLQVVGRDLGRRDEAAVLARQNGSSPPPLKKNVTCAYFSVSAMRSCLSPFCASTSLRMLSSFTGGNATCRLDGVVVLRHAHVGGQ